MSEALFISADHARSFEINSSAFRIAVPAGALRNAGHTIHVQNSPPFIHAHYGEVDRLDYAQMSEVVLAERSISPERVELMRLAGAERIVLTFDDNYACLPPYSPSAAYWKRHLADFKLGMREVDLVIVPSVALANAYCDLAKEITVVPNYHFPELWVGDVPKHKRIGWGGSLQHQDSWDRSRILPALRSILERHSEWEFHCHGMTVEAPGAFHGWQSMDKWAQSVMAFGIGLAPLAGEYDRYRSNLKLVEYGMARVPYIATAMEPYTMGDVSPGGILVRNPGDWLGALDFLISSRDERERLGALGWEWAQKYRSERCVPIYEEALWG